MALFAALTLVGIMDGQVPFDHLINATFGTDIHGFGWTVPALAAILLTALVMVVFAIAVQKFIFAHLVNQEPIILFMATIGLAYFLEGTGDLMWGSDIKTLDVGLPQGINETIDRVTFDAVRLRLLHRQPRHRRDDRGRDPRRAPSSPSASTPSRAGPCAPWPTTIRRRCSVGISLSFIWVLVWSIAGFVALVAGIMWGAKSGVQFSLSLIALKALPVLMLGGFTSIPGAIVGGLIIGVGEKLFEFLVGPLVGGATENWFAYVLALIFLVFRPQGLFGERIIERV